MNYITEKEYNDKQEEELSLIKISATNMMRKTVRTKTGVLTIESCLFLSLIRILLRNYSKQNQAES